MLIRGRFRIRPEERDLLRFHWLRNIGTKEVETLRFTRARIGLGPSPFFLGWVIEQHLDTWSPKQPEIVREIKKNLYVDELISGGTTVSKAREMIIVPTEKADNTKRGILAKIARTYDLLGVVSPLTLCGKLLYRDASQPSWDEQLPSDLAAKWAKWESRSPERITFMRTLVKYQEPISCISIHVFGDASCVGVAAAAFIVVS